MDAALRPDGDVQTDQLADYVIPGCSNCGVRLLDRAVRRSLPVVIVNRGATHGDSRATVRLEGGTSKILAALAERL